MNLIRLCSKHIVIIALIALLITRYILSIHFFKYISVALSYDEIIFLNIVNRPIKEIIEIIKYEPNPLGSYILAKLLYVDNNLFTTRTRILSVGYLFVGLTVIWGYKKDIIAKYKLRYGLAIYLSSYIYLSMFSYMKVHSVSQALFFPFIFLLLYLLDKKPSSISWLNILSLNVAFLMLFFIDYSASLLCGFIYGVWLIYIGYFGKQKKVWVMVFMNVLILLFYSYVFLWKQISNGLGRGIWFEYGAYTIHALVGEFISLKVEFSPAFDILFFGFIGFAALGTRIKLKFLNIEGYIFKYVTYLMLSALLLFAYITGLLALSRYVYVILFILSICAGWGMESISDTKYLPKKHLIALKLAFILILFSYSWMVYKVIQVSNTTGVDLHRKVLKNLTETADDRIGYIYPTPITSYVFKIGYSPDLERLVPFNPFFDDSTSLSSDISAEHLAMDRDLSVYLEGFTETDLLSNLKESGLSDFIYVTLPKGESVYYSSDKIDMLIEVLDDNCKSINPVLSYTLLIRFKECSF